MVLTDCLFPTSVERDRAWRALTGAADAVAPEGFPFFATADLRCAGVTSETFVRRRRDQGALLTLARGCHLAVPNDAAADWRPDEREVGWLIAAARFGRERAYLSGLTAASLHQAAPRGHWAVHVTVPGQARRLDLPALHRTLVFHHRVENVIGFDAFLFPPRLRGTREGPELWLWNGEMCTMLVTSPAQTALDLWHSPGRAGNAREAQDAAKRLERRVGPHELLAVSVGQRRMRALSRLWNLRQS